MRFPFAVASFAALCIASAACSSANFDVSSSGDGGTDDTAEDPCAPVKDVAKFCVTVTAAPGHPGYDSTSVGTLPLDGHGTLQLILYPADPIANPGTTPLPPIQFRGGAEIDIDADLPVTFADSAPEGTYWFVAAFEDDATTPRDLTKQDSSLPGDFISLPKIDSNLQITLPQLTLTKGQTMKFPDLTLKAVRRVQADLTPTLALEGVKAANSTLHGDGPTLFLIYDGTLDSTTPPPTLYDAKQGDCVQLFDKTAGYPKKVLFNTTVDGTHNILAVLFDYDVPKGTKFPGKGAILSPIHDLSPDVRVAQFNPGSQWTTETEISMASVNDPYSPASPPADTFACH